MDATVGERRVEAALGAFGEVWWAAIPAADRGELRLWHGRLDLRRARLLAGGSPRRVVCAYPDRVVIDESWDVRRAVAVLWPVSYDHARVLSLGLYPWYSTTRVREVLGCSADLCRAGLGLAGLGSWPPRSEDLAAIASEVRRSGAGSPVDVFSMIQRLRAAGFDDLSSAGSEIAAGLAHGWQGQAAELVELAGALAKVGS